MAISHRSEDTDICLDFLGEGHGSIANCHERRKEDISEGIQRAFKLNYLYPTELKQTLKVWKKNEKIRFVSNYTRSEKKETLESDGNEWFLHVKMLGNKKRTEDMLVIPKEDAWESEGGKMPEEIELQSIETTALLSSSGTPEEVEEGSAESSDEEVIVYNAKDEKETSL